MNRQSLSANSISKQINFKQAYCFLKRFWLFQETKIDSCKIVPIIWKNERKTFALTEKECKVFHFFFFSLDFVCVLIHKQNN